MVDAILPIGNYENNKHFYVFSGTRYAEYKFTSSGTIEHVAGPKDNREWNTFRKADWGAVDAIVPVPSKTNEFYVFLGGHYFRGSIDPSDGLSDSMNDGGVMTIVPVWKGLVDSGIDTIDAGIAHPTDGDSLYFFSGTRCIKYSWSEDRIIWNYTITESWPSIGNVGFDSVDAIFTSAAKGSTLYHVFRGDKVAELAWDGSEHETLTWGPQIIKSGEGGTWKILGDWI